MRTHGEGGLWGSCPSVSVKSLVFMGVSDTKGAPPPWNVNNVSPFPLDKLLLNFASNV